MKVAIVHDWLTGMRGGELVLDSLLKLYPDADLFTLIYNRGKLNSRIESRKIQTAFTDRLPFKETKYRSFLPLFPAAIESLDMKGYDLILSSSHCVAKGVIPHPNTKHLTYIHSPMRYVWDLYYDYFPNRSGLKFFLLQLFSNYLRTWDVVSSTRVDLFTCNSHFIAKRIWKYYRREATVIHPPCLPEGFTVQESTKDDYYLIVSAFAPYKRIDLAIEAFRKSKKRLLIIGSGQDQKKLLKNVPENIEFLGGLPHGDIKNYYLRAKGFLFPGLEDFGITPVESQGYCTPVIAFGEGGALETVVEGKTGVFFSEQTPESLESAVLRSESISYQRKDFQDSVNRFTEEKFINEIRKSVDRL